MMFVGSPIEVSQADLVKTGKALKKNGVAVDIVNFGEAEQNSEKLEAFIEAVNKDGNRYVCPRVCFWAADPSIVRANDDITLLWQSTMRGSTWVHPGRRAA